ncbi:D-allulose 6-phosphate 3-epimerase [Erysipelotrichaceae bacterium 51-3]
MEQFAPSLMCMDLVQMKKQLNVLDQQMDLYHFDIMDGHYCKNITLSPMVLKAVRQCTDKYIDVHLMTTEPADWVEACATAGASCISPHAETINTDAFRMIHKIKDAGCDFGVVLNPATPLSYVEPYLNSVDILTIMTVDVGFAGQKFIEEMLDKIALAKKLREERGYHYRIQIDGSCNKANYKALREAGADIYIIGNKGLFSLDPDLRTACEKMKEEFRKETA